MTAKLSLALLLVFTGFSGFAQDGFLLPGGEELDVCRYHPTQLGYERHPDKLVEYTRFYTGDLSAANSARFEGSAAGGFLRAFYGSACQLPGGARVYYLDLFDPSVGAYPHAYICDGIVTENACHPSCQFYMINLSS